MSSRDIYLRFNIFDWPFQQFGLHGSSKSSTKVQPFRRKMFLPVSGSLLGECRNPIEINQSGCIFQHSVALCLNTAFRQHCDEG